jgi:hypothetical protein
MTSSEVDHRDDAPRGFSEIHACLGIFGVAVLGQSLKSAPPKFQESRNTSTSEYRMLFVRGAPCPIRRRGWW